MSDIWRIPQLLGGILQGGGARRQRRRGGTKTSLHLGGYTVVARGRGGGQGKKQWEEG